MAVLGTILKIFSYFFHLLLTLGLIAISSIAIFSDTHNLQFGMLPWKGSALTWWLFGLGLLGLVSLVLALKGALRILFLLWTVLVVILLARGYLFSGYSFDGADEFTFAMYVLAAAVLAMFGGLFQFRSKRGFRPR